MTRKSIAGEELAKWRSELRVGQYALHKGIRMVTVDKIRRRENGTAGVKVTYEDTNAFGWVDIDELFPLDDGRYR